MLPVFRNKNKIQMLKLIMEYMDFLLFAYKMDTETETIHDLDNHTKTAILMAKDIKSKHDKFTTHEALVAVFFYWQIKDPKIQ